MKAALVIRLVSFQVFLFSGGLWAASDVILRNTSIRIPYSVFDSLISKKIDTVTRPVEDVLPFEITFNNIQITAVLHDSMAEISLDGFYTVLSKKGWAQERLFIKNDLAISKISVAAGDVIRLTNTGYILAAASAGEKGPRRIRMQWFVHVKSSEGVSSLQCDIPKCLQRGLIIVAPASFTDVTVENAFLEQQVRTGAVRSYKYLLSSTEGNCEISWQAPVKPVAADSVETTEEVVPSDVKSNKPVITACQETALFVDKESRFAFTAIHLSVARAPVSRFTVQLPDSFVLLSISGNGLQTSAGQNKTGPIACRLAFDLEGDYTFYIAGEMPGDSIVDIPAVKIIEAAHQAGTFAITTEKGTESHYMSAINCSGISEKEFMNELSPEFTDSLFRYEHTLNSISLTGKYFRIPFVARIKLLHHQPVDVADAICDVVSLRTVISSEEKVLTQATYSIRHRGRQFVSLLLPDSARLWSVTLNSVPVSPSADVNGRHKISLQRDYESDAAGKPQILELTYLYLSKKISGPDPLRMIAPVPDIAVSRLDWTVFYPEAWSVKKVDGTLITAKENVFGKQTLHLNNNDRQSLYAMMQQTIASQQTAVQDGKNVLALMPGSQKHFYGYMILVEGEKPWMEIQFGSATVDVIVKTIVLVVVVSIGVFAAVYFRRRLKAR
jgi:hypothetical protein